MTGDAPRTLFVMGGGGFIMEPDNPLLDEHVVSLSPRANPRVGFIGTATGDDSVYRDRFYDAYRKLECRPTHLSLFKPPTRDLAAFVSELDVVHVGGGNTKNLLAIWRDWGLDRVLLDAYRRGLVLTGLSAGMICWFEQGLTDSFGGLDALDGLGWLRGSATPHYDGEPERRPRYLELVRSGAMSDGIALDDGVGALYVNEQLVECVSSRPHAMARLVTASDETELEVRRLGAR